MSNTQQARGTSRLAVFMRRHGILSAELQRASGCSRQALRRVRLGTTEPTKRFMAAVLAGARRIVGTKVVITDLFDFEGGAYSGAVEEWRRVTRPGRPPTSR